MHRDNSDGRKKTNIILINADDLGYAGIGCYGQKLIQALNIDKMAEEGMRFTDFYAANTVCVPSRYGLITGQHPGHAGIRDNFMPHVNIKGLRVNKLSLFNAFAFNFPITSIWLMQKQYYL